MDTESRHSLGTKGAGAPKKKGTTRKRVWVLVFCIVTFCMMFVSYAVRTSTYLHARIQPKLEQLGEKLGGAFEFRNIYAVGMTGIVLDDVTFQPYGMTASGSLRFESVTIYPDMLGMFIGDLNASAIEVKGLGATVDFTDSPHSHRTWMMARRDALASSADAMGGSVDTADSTLKTMPELRCVDCHIKVSHEKANVELDIPVQALSFDNPFQPWQAITLSGEEVGACVEPLVKEVADKFAEPLCVKVSTTGMAFESEAIHLNDLSVGAFEHKSFRLNVMKMKNVEVTLRGERRFVHVADGRLDFEIDASVSQFSGKYAFDYREFELLHEHENDRLGFGIAIKSDNDAMARLFGGYDVGSKEVGMTVECRGLDFAPLFKGASFFRQIKIDSLPITGTVELSADLKHENYYINVDGGVEDGSVTIPMIAKETLSDIWADLELKAHWDAPSRIMSVDVSQGHLGKILFSAGFVYEPLEAIEAEKGAAVPAVPKSGIELKPPFHVGASLEFSGEAGEFLDALPENFAPALKGYKLEGPFSGKVELKFDSDNLDALALDVNLALDEVKTLAFDPRSNFDLIKTNNFLIKVNTATVPVMIGPRAQNWASFYDLPRDTAYTFIASEDAKFFTHSGLDLRAIRASLIANLKAEKFVRGGSTISQQVVKNLFLNQDKTFSRKFQEAFLTWQMEKTLTKLRIFELYLNLAHWGKDTYGIREAAKYYFQKNVRELTLSESLFLASILPNPIIFGKQYADNKLSSSRTQKMINVANALYGGKRIDKATLDETVSKLKDGKISDRPRPHIE